MASAGSMANASAAGKFYEHFRAEYATIKSTIASDRSEAAQRLRQLDIALREANIYLPAYDQKHLTKDLEELRALLHKQSETKRFGFKFKKATTTSKVQPKKAEELQPEQAASSTDSPDSYVFKDIAGEWVVPEPRSAANASTDGELRDISESVVDLRSIGGSLRALNCRRLQNCIVICGPFAGSTTIRDSSNCVFIIGVRQFRMENSRNIDVYLHCASHPIIEKSTEIRFAPYPEFRSKAMEEEFARSGLKGIPNSFDKVDDFNWLKRQASPNWSLNDSPIADWSALDDALHPRQKLLDVLPQAK